MYLGIAIFCLAFVSGYFCNNDIHHFMSKEEVQQMFHINTESVPEYEIVEIEVSERLKKRDLPEENTNHIRMRAFGENINLWLHPTDSILAGVNTPIYYARYSPYKPRGVEYRRRDGLMAMVGRIFEDPNTLASFVIGADENGRTRVNGNIGSRNLAVRSLPPRVAEEYRRRRSTGDLKDSDKLYHIVFKSNELNEVRHPLLPINETRLRQRVARSTIPSMLYPEVLVVVDNSIYSAEKHDIYGFLEYLLALWNGVDLRYRSLENPGVRFHIAGIVLSEDIESTPYIAYNKLEAEVFNSTQAMLDIPTFYYAIRSSMPLESYDIAVTLTRLRFGLGNDGGIQGLARIGAACQRSSYTQTVDGLALVMDRGTFDSVHVLAHEVGHLLGASHDSDSKECSFKHGFIMAIAVVTTSNSSDFSTCSMDSFQQYLGRGQLSCLYNRPLVPGRKLPNLMPGKMRTLDQQCSDAYMGNACQPASQNVSLCIRMYCLDERGECGQNGYAALDGTPCEGENKFCLHTQCVSL